MNKYQKRKSREIKQIMKLNPFGQTTYKMAKWHWRMAKRFDFFHPCEDCDTLHCDKVGKPIAYCADMKSMED